jgi:hypothetical protein
MSHEEYLKHLTGELRRVTRIYAGLTQGGLVLYRFREIEPFKASSQRSRHGRRTVNNFSALPITFSMASDL